MQSRREAWWKKKKKRTDGRKAGEVGTESKKLQKCGGQDVRLNTGESLLVSADDMLVKTRHKHLQPAPPCLSQRTQSTRRSVFTCVRQGYSHTAVLPGHKVTLRGDKSPHPCRRVLALHPQTHNSHKLATNSRVTLAFFPLSSFLLSFLTLFLVHLFS